MNDKRQKNQLQMALAFTGEGRSEAPKTPREGTESFTAKCETESPAGEESVGKANSGILRAITHAQVFRVKQPLKFLHQIVPILLAHCG
jgi:hypothetical protein